jgi:hypothetical protein
MAGTLKAEIYDGISGTGVDQLLQDPKWAENRPSRGTYSPGLLFGRPNGLAGWSESFGDNYGVRIRGVLTPRESGQFHFFIRSDDASRFFLNQNGAAIPDPNFEAPLIEEAACCSSFLEPNDLNKPLVTTAVPIDLVAGNSYGFAVLMKEGGGGDGVAVGMRKVGDPTPAAEVPPIQGLLVQGVGDAVGATLDITNQPANVTVIANEEATFTVGASATTRYGNGIWYQWLRDGMPIPGAVGSSYANPAVPASWNASQISAVVGAAGIIKTSAVATVTVTPDTQKPIIVSSVQANNTFTNLMLRFSEPVTSPTATTLGNYGLSGGASITSATLSPDGFSVNLGTSLLPMRTNFTLTINNVQDIAGNAILANTQVQIPTWVQILNSLQGSYWGGINGTAVNLLTTDPRYPSAPDSTLDVTNGLTVGIPSGNAGWAESFGDNFGARVTGTITAPGTGQWHFFIRSDDASQFFLNTTGPAIPATTGTPLMQETGCCATFQEPGTAEETTMTPVSLVAGQQYGFAALFKEGGGGDGVGVAMRIVGDTTPAANLAPIAVFGPQVVGRPPISIAKSGNTWQITYSGTLQAAGTADGPYADVAGATSPYTVDTSTGMRFFRARN